MAQAKKEIRLKMALEIAQSYFIPADYNCETWEEVVDEAMHHADGIAAGLAIDDEYVVNVLI